MIRDIDNSNTGSSPGPWHARILAWPLSVVVDFEKLVTSAPRVGLGRVRDLVFFLFTSSTAESGRIYCPLAIGIFGAYRDRRSLASTTHIFIMHFLCSAQ